MYKTALSFLMFFFIFCSLLHAATYPVAIAEKGLWQEEYTAFARVTAQAETTLTMPFAIKITRIMIHPGQKVSTGKVLFRFQSPAFLKDISAYAKSRRLFLLEEKQQKILRRGISEHTITRRDVLRGNKEIVKIEAELERAWDKVHTDLMLLNNDMQRKDFDLLLNNKTPLVVADTLSVLRAPFAGTILDNPSTAGLWIQANTPALRLEDLHRIYVTVAVSEKMLDKWLSGETLVKAKATVIRLDPVPGTAQVDISSGLRQLLFTADNPENFFGNGQWIRVIHRGPEKSVIWVPASAVVSRNNQNWCIVMNDKKYTPERIESGPTVAGKVPVFSGLTAGQQVVKENAYELLYRDLKELIKFVD